MARNGQADLLQDLLACRNTAEAKKIIGTLEKEYGCQWVPVGGRENNYGQINIGSDPGFALVERVTNAIDAVVERAAIKSLNASQRKQEKLPTDPRQAVERWFEIDAGRIRNLTNERRQSLADNVVISLFPGSTGRSHPSVLIRDLGVGISPTDVPSTILSLGGGNKINKRYLAGAYGQGGSTTFAFATGGTIIATRRAPELGDALPDVVAITFVRFSDLDPEVNKNGRYEYLVLPGGEVPSVDSDVIDFPPGTEVLHFDYELTKYSSAMTQVTGSLWWLLQNALFDPILPLWAEDHRLDIIKKQARERRSIVGNHSRLWSDRNEKLDHTDHVEIVLPHEEGQSRIVAHYWVAKIPEGATKRARPIESFVDPYKPVTYTYFGQTHGFEDQRFIRDRLQLPYLDRYLIIQVELDHLAPRARRNILSTTRDRLKESQEYDDLRERLAHALAEDEELIRLNEQRKEALLSTYSESERQKMRERFARLLENHSAGRDAEVPSKGSAELGRSTGGGRGREPLPPLKTGTSPTFLRIVNVQKPVQVRIDRAAVLRLESDAPDGYVSANDPHARLILTVDPAKNLVMESRSDFKGGRARVLVRPGSDAKVDDEGVLGVVLVTPDNESFSDRVRYRVIPKEDRSTSGDSRKGQVKAPEPVPIHKDQWDRLGWDEASVAQVERDVTGVRILVNMDNQHISRLVKKGGYQETGLARMTNGYLLYCAYYAWLQENALQGDDHGLSGDEFERYKQEELDRAAQTVVSAIAAQGRL